MPSAVAPARQAALFCALLGVTEGFRSQSQSFEAASIQADAAAHAAADAVAVEGLVGFGCTRKKTCGECLADSPFSSSWTRRQGAYCQWCAAENWVGDKKDLKGRPGVCVAGWTKRADKCGGAGWHFLPNNNATNEPKVAENSTAAAPFCPASADADGRSLSKMTAADLTQLLNQTDALTMLLGSINMDIERLDTLRGVNPALFGKKFGTSWADTAGKWAWKVGVFSTNFVPVPGLNFALGMASEAATSAIALVAQQGKSQFDLITKGADTGVSYFSDVNFGQVLSAYNTIYGMSDEEVELALHTIAGSAIAGKGGKAAGTFQSIGDSALAKTGKAALQTGLFVGGFFSGGITWIVSMGIGAASLGIGAGMEAGLKKAASMKMQMLMGMARAMDSSAWRNSTQACDITAWYDGHNPCPPQSVPGVEEPIKRVCSRFSPWGNHLGTISGSPGDPEGRCLPASDAQLALGMPCLTDTSCFSGFCHFEPKLQYFFSDHVRRHCKNDSSDCLSAAEQLEVLEHTVRALPDGNGTLSQSEKKLHSIVKKYDSYDGVNYATTGTCAVACPASVVGKGDCEALARRAQPGSSFGIRHRAFNLFAGGEGFTRMGTGDCASTSGPLAANVTVRLESTGTHRYKECARRCVQLGMVAFSVDHVNGECSIFLERALKTTPHERTVCFERRFPWPFDIYQPWNAEWKKYKLSLAKVLTFLKVGKGLPEVREAYKNYCEAQHSHMWLGHHADSDSVAGCPSPETWDQDKALRMLWSVAPLSASQLHELHAKLDPESAEAVADGSQDTTLSREELIMRPKGFGEAWAKLLASSKMDSDHGISRSLAEQFEALAEEGDLRAPDGVWDLAKAGEIYVQEKGLSSGNA